MSRKIVRKFFSAVMLSAAALLAAPQAQADGIFIACPDGHSGVATPVTSCAFAANVARAYFGSYGATLVNAYSPVTGQVYTMQCAGGFTADLSSGWSVRAARCVGGNNAVVIVY